MSTKRLLSLVSKPFHRLVEEFLLEALVVTEFDRLAQLRNVLSSERSVNRPGEEPLPKGSYCRRLDFVLGRRGHYWAGEGHSKGFKSLWGLLPTLKNLQILIIDPYQSGNLWDNVHMTFSKAFWNLLRTRCAHSLRLLHINSVETDAGQIHSALAPFTKLESLELRGGWHGRTPPPETSTRTLPHLHNLRAFYPEIMSAISMPVLRHVNIVTSSVNLRDGSMLKIRPESLVELDYCGPPLDIFELCNTFPNLKRFGLFKPRVSNSGNLPWILNEGYAEKLEEIDLFNLCSWSLATLLVSTVAAQCRDGAFPALKRVKYVEQECYLRGDEAQNVQAQRKPLDDLGIEFVSEKKWFSLY